MIIIINKIQLFLDIQSQNYEQEMWLLQDDKTVLYLEEIVLQSNLYKLPMLEM